MLYISRESYNGARIIVFARQYYMVYAEPRKLDMQLALGKIFRVHVYNKFGWESKSHYVKNILYANTNAQTDNNLYMDKTYH